MNNSALMALGALALLGCGPTLKFTARGEARPPKAPTCSIAVLTTPPPEPYEKLGIIDIQYDNTGFINNPEDLKKKIQPEVCRVGGDAALAFANTYGTYIKVTVLSLKPAAESAPAAESSESGGEAPEAGEAKL
jgi:hypothetical protein